MEEIEKDDGTPVVKNEENHYQLLVESIKDYAIIALDTEGRITLWNRGAQRLKGYTAEEVIGKNFSLFYTPEAIAQQYPAYELKRAAEGGFEDEGWRVR